MGNQGVSEAQEPSNTQEVAAPPHPGMVVQQTGDCSIAVSYSPLYSNVPRVRPTSPNAAAAEDTTREDLRSRSPSPELPAPEFPDTDPLASSTDTEPMTPDQS